MKSNLPSIVRKRNHVWTVCDAETYKNFSATAFFFAYHLSKETGVPIGLLNCTQGNTRIDQWMSVQGAEIIADEPLWPSGLVGPVPLREARVIDAR